MFRTCTAVQMRWQKQCHNISGKMYCKCGICCLGELHRPFFFWDIWGNVVALRDASSINQVYPDSCFKSVAVDNSYSVPQLSILCPVNQLDLNQLLHIISGRQLTWSNCIHCVLSVTACSLLPLGSLTQRDGNGQKQVHRLPSGKLT